MWSLAIPLVLLRGGADDSSRMMVTIYWQLPTWHIWSLLMATILRGKGDGDNNSLTIVTKSTCHVPATKLSSLHDYQSTLSNLQGDLLLWSPLHRWEQWGSERSLDRAKFDSKSVWLHRHSSPWHYIAKLFYGQIFFQDFSTSECLKCLIWW